MSVERINWKSQLPSFCHVAAVKSHHVHHFNVAIISISWSFGTVGFTTILRAG